MPNLKIIIVDDEPLVGYSLKKNIAKRFPDDEVLATVNTFAEAKKAIKSQQPNLLILDVFLDKGKKAFDLLDSLKSLAFQIIFVSAYERENIEEVLNKYPVVNYLKKPIDLNLLNGAVTKAKKRLAEQEVLSSFQDTEGESTEEEEEEMSSNNIVTLRLIKGRLTVVNLTNVIRFESNGDLTVLFFEKEKKTAVKSLKEFEQMVSPKLFFRVHKQHIVNLNFINKLHTRPKLEVELFTGEKIPLARRRKEDFIKSFTLFQRNNFPEN